MKLNIKEDKQWLWYTIFAVCFTILLLYIKFPSEAVTKYVRVEAEKNFPDLNINFRKIGLALSPGIKIEGLRVSFKEAPDTPVYISEKSSIRISILSWLKGDPKYYFKSNVKGGEISGFIEEKNELKKERMDATIDIKGVKLDENSFIHPIVRERIEGILSGKVTFMGNLSDPIRGNSVLSLNLSEGSYKLKEPFLGINRIGFKNINLSGIINNQRFNIKDMKMTGGPFSGTATGTVRINSSNLFNSRLDLKAEIEPTPSLAQDMPGVERLIKNMMKGGKLRVDLQGTIESPSFKIR